MGSGRTGTWIHLSDGLPSTPVVPELGRCWGRALALDSARLRPEAPPCPLLAPILRLASLSSNAKWVSARRAILRA